MRGRVTPTNPNGSSYRSIVGHFGPGTMERIMKKISLAVVSAALAAGMAAPASAGVNDPEVIIYRFPGVRDLGGGSAATVFACTNFSGVTEVLRFATRTHASFLVSNVTMNIGHLETKNAVTRVNNAYAADQNLSTNTLNSGTTAIAATSINIICTGMVIDASNAVPNGLALRGIRFNPIPGSQE